MIYTGVGSRFSSAEINRLFERTGEYLASKGHTLRSGGAAGCDSAFERGCDAVNGAKDIFYPADSTKRAEEIAQSVINDAHWGHLRLCVRRLHARNVLQVLGRDFETPSDFLICWTKDGKDIGGTATAIKLARLHKIPIINAGQFLDPGMGSRWAAFVKKVKELAG